MEYEKVGGSESEKAIKNSPNVKTKPRNTPDVPEVPRLEVPASVRDIIYRIQRAQVTRARDDIKTQMDDIMSNVDRIMARYNLGFNPPSIKSIFLKEHMRKQRTTFLESLATYTKNAENREKTLAYILAWLEEWNAILSDITTFDIDEHYHWIVQMEMFPDTLRAIENNVNILCSMSSTFLKDKKTQKKKTVSRGALWKTWKDRYIKRPATAYALRPDQMIADQYTTNTKVLEIQNMLQELIGSAMFTKLENTAIKYISSTILNLSKALSAAAEQLNISNIVNDSAFFQKYETERELSRRIIYDLSEQNEKLQRKLQEREEQYEIIQLKSVRDQQYESSSTAMTNVKADYTKGSLDSILAKELDNTLYKSLAKKIKDSETKPLLKAPTEVKSELTEEQYLQSEGKTKRASWPYEYAPGGKTSRQSVDVYLFNRTGYYQIERREHTKSPYVQDRPGSNVGEDGGEKTLSEAKTNEYYELGETENEREGIKPRTSSEPESQYYPISDTKSQDAKSGTPYEAEQARKFKTEPPLEKGHILPGLKEPPLESANKRTRGLADLLNMAQVKQSLMPQKAEVQGKTQDAPLTMSRSKIWRREPKETPAIGKQPKPPPLEKSRPNTQEGSGPERALATPELKGEESDTESFQKALMDFLKEKINNIDKPADDNTMPRKESLLKRAEMENFETIKAKMDEYFQKMAEIVTQMVRKFKVAKKEGADGEKPRIPKKLDSFMPAPQDETSSTTAKSEISIFLSNENIDPVMKNVIETILAEIESEGDAPTVSTVRKEHKKAKPKQEKHGQEGQEKMQDKSSLQKEADIMTEARKTTVKQPGMQGVRGETLSLDLKAEKHHQQKARGKKEDKQKPSEGAERLERQRESAAGHPKTKGKKPEDKTKGTAQESQLPQGRSFHEVSGLPPETTYSLPSTPPPSPQVLLPGALHIYPQPFIEHKNIIPQLGQAMGRTLTPREAQPLGSTLIPQWTQALGRLQTLQHAQAWEATLTLQQAQALGTTLTPQQAQALGTILTPQQAQALGTILTSQQAQALGTTPTPQQIQALGTTLTPEEAQALGTILTPQQAHALGTTLTPQQAQALGTILTPQQTQALGTILTSQQAQALGTTPIPQQIQALGTILTPQEDQAPRTILTSQQAQALGTILTPQQAQALGTILTPQHAQALGTILTPQQTQALGTILTPQQAQALGTTPTPQQIQALGTILTPEEAQALGTILTPQQAQALGTILTPQQAQALGTILTPQQAQALGTTLTSQQIQVLGTILTSQQAQILGGILTPQEDQAPRSIVTSQQAQALGTILTPQQAQALGTILIPQEAQALGATLTLQQVQALGTTLTPEQAQALGTTLIPQQPQVLGTILTPQQAQALGTILTSQQVQILGETLTPQEEQALETTLTPEKDQALGTTLAPEEDQALGTALAPAEDQALGTALIPQKAQDLGNILTSLEDQALGTTLTPEEDQVLGTILTPQEDQTLGTTLIPQEAQDLETTLTPQEDQTQGETLTLQEDQTPQQVQALGTTLIPQEAQALGISLTPQQAQTLGITLIPQQIMALGITRVPQEDKALGSNLIPQHFQPLGITLTYQEDQVLGTTLTLQQAQALGITLPPQEPQILGTSLTPQEDQAPETILIPQEPQALGKTLTSQQAQALGTTLTPEEDQALETILIPQQVQDMGTALTPEQVPALETILIPQQVQDMGTALTPEQVQALETILIPQQVQDMGTTLTLEQAQASVTTFIPQEARALRTITPVKAQFLGTSPVSQQAQALGLTLISEQAETQAQALQPPFTGRPTLTLRAPAAPAPQDSLAVKAAGTSEQIQAMQISPHMQQPQLFRVPSTQEHAKLTQAVGATPAPEPVQAMEFPFASMQARPLRMPAFPELFPVSGTPPTPGQLLELEALSSGQLFLPRDPLTARPRPVLEGTPTPRWPITSGMTSVSAKIPSVWRPLTPGKSFPEELKESRPLSIAGKPLEHQHAPRKQSPSLPAPSTLRQQLTPLTLRALQEPGKSQPSLTPQLLIASQKPQWDQKSRFPPIEKLWMVTSRSDTDKAKTVGPLQELERKTYFIDVSAQRKNLALLNQAVRTSGLPSHVHMIARNLIIETLHTDAVRLGHLLHKYVAYRLIQRVRNNIIHQIKVIQNTGKGYETQKLYLILSKIDDYQKKVMCAWTEKQKFLEETRNQCLKKMISLFSQLRNTYKLNLSQPVPLITHKNEIPTSVESAQQTYQKLPIEEEKHSVKKIRHQEDQTDAIWKTDLSTSSYPIIEKTPINVPWDQLGGYPDIPRLLQLDVQSTFRKSLASIKMQIKKTPK